MLNVVFASDNEYSSFLNITILSLLKNNKEDFDMINIYILDDGISNENKIKINNLTEKYNCNLIFIPTKNLEELEINIFGLKRNINHVSFTTYSRLFISTLIPQDIKKIIYFDCDALIVGSLKELFEIDINNYYCGAVLDAINSDMKKRLGFEPNENYVNAGFLLINLDKWRNDNVEEKFIEFMKNNQNKFYQHDQGIINNVFKNKILILKPEYNLQNVYQFLDYDLAKTFSANRGKYYSKEILDNAKKHPIFLHFCGPNYDRPWFNINHPYKDLFYNYAKLANCENIINYNVHLPLKSKLFYKFINNSFLIYILKLFPNSFVINLLSKNSMKQFDKANEKAKLI